MKLTLFWRFVIETEWLHFAFDANDRSWVACICLIGRESGAWRRHVEKISHTTYILPSAVTSAATAVQPAELRVSRGSMQTPSRRWGKTIISTMYLEWNENESFSNRSHAIELITWFVYFKPYFFCFPPATGITCCGGIWLFGLWFWGSAIVQHFVHQHPQNLQHNYVNCGGPTRWLSSHNCG